MNGCGLSPIPTQQQQQQQQRHHHSHQRERGGGGSAQSSGLIITQLNELVDLKQATIERQRAELEELRALWEQEQLKSKEEKQRLADLAETKDEKIRELTEELDRRTDQTNRDRVAFHKAIGIVRQKTEGSVVEITQLQQAYEELKRAAAEKDVELKKVTAKLQSSSERHRQELEELSTRHKQELYITKKNLEDLRKQYQRTQAHRS
eukprot:gnl/Hemi2/24407_TR8205_c1_g1_i1.p1 gnl/Hemi2/24407_TR8205_c1_g1~~gnl/Hemi2/24407_TR8205_c1_g1_i1.p1  ORF type:complete len:207 (-),score=57.31 gnl/Hemi2/24407_TR8205_c1_g1_i1:232-852(-)